MKDYQKTASEILRLVGGEKNVSHLEHCSTRLRFTLKDTKKADIEALKKVTGVMGVVMTAQCQVIIGNDVIEMYDALMKLASFQNDGAEQAQQGNGEKKKIGAVVMDFIVGVFQPLVPAIAGAGILKAMLSLLTLVGWMDSTSVTYQVFYFAADAALYFLPLMVAVTVASKLKCNKLVALAAVGALILPGMTALLGEGSVFLGFTLKNIAYSYQVFPALLSVMFLALVEKGITRISPKPIRIFFVPMMTFIIVVPVTLLILGPIGFTIGQGLTAVILFLYEKLGWIAVALLAAILPLMIATGMHKALVPYAVSSITEMGKEFLYMPASLAHNISESGACFAVALRTRNSDTRSTAVSAGISALFGITEPALYGVVLQRKKVLMGVMIGSFAGGLSLGLTAVRAFVAMGPGLAGMAMFVDPEDAMNIVWSFVGFGISILVSFLATFFLYREESGDKKNGAGITEGNPAGLVSDGSDKKAVGTDPDKTGEEAGTQADLVSPMTGRMIPIREVKDDVFSQGILGDGVALVPEEGALYAPADGQVVMVIDSRHAVSMKADNGAEILLHVGLDTVRLEGKGFEPQVKAGDRVKAGQLLLRFDLQALKEAGFDVTTPVVITNMDAYGVSPEAYGPVKAGEKLLRLEALRAGREAI